MNVSEAMLLSIDSKLNHFHINAKNRLLYSRSNGFNGLRMRQYVPQFLPNIFHFGSEHLLLCLSSINATKFLLVSWFIVNLYTIFVRFNLTLQQKRES